MKYSKFKKELAENEALVSSYIIGEAQKTQSIKPQIIEECTMSYVNSGGKKLRSAVLNLSCQAVGGKVESSLPAAAAVELFHTWTLVHDDIIDNDELRRGVPTVHVTAANYAREKLNIEPITASKYGKDAAILTGDIQHGWSIAMISRNLTQQGIKPEIALHLISNLEVEMLRTLLEGEMLDVNFGLFYEIEDLTEEMILDMLWKKTGVFYEFCGMAGAMIGKNQLEMDEQIIGLKDFCSLCGTAFQVRDDILGLIGKKESLGKPVGSDIREGKKTLLVKEALSNASESESIAIKKTLGNAMASATDIENTTNLILKLGGLERAHSIARNYVNQAIPKLDVIPDSKYKDLLFDWANYMIDRNY